MIVVVVWCDFVNVLNLNGGCCGSVVEARNKCEDERGAIFICVEISHVASSICRTRICFESEQ